MLQNIMKMLYYVLCQFLFGYINHIINSSEVVHSLQNIINRHTIHYVQRICFKNQTSLVLREFATLNMIRIKSQTNLKFVIKAAGNPCFFFFSKHLKNPVVRYLTHQKFGSCPQIISYLLNASS